MSEEQLADYLARPPFVGDSHFRDKDVVKAAGGRFDPRAKAFVAPDVLALQRLLRTGRWRARGFGNQDALADAAAAWVRARVQKADAKLQREAEAALQLARAAAQARAEQRRRAVEHLIEVPADEPATLAWLEEKHGVTAEMVNVSAGVPELGPRSGLSAAARVRRAFALGDGRLGVGLRERLQALCDGAR